VPTSNVDGAALEHVTSLGDRIEANVARAGDLRARKQDANARQAQRIGKPRNIKVGNFVFIANNGETQPTKWENKQLQSGPFRVKQIDQRRKRARLERPDGGELDTPIAFSRLQLVSDDAVLTKIAATSDLGGWDGAADARYLLDADRRAIAKAAEERAAEAARIEEDRRQAEATEAAKRLKKENEARARAAQEAELANQRARNAELQRRRATVAVP
jgi:hypothetical protein